MEEDSFILSNLNAICRLCLGKNGVMSAIFEVEVDPEPEIPLLTKISDFVELQIHPGDGLPPSICHRCLFKTEWLAQFRSQCVMNDAKLRRLTRQQLSSPNEDGDTCSQDEYDENADNDDKDKVLDYNIEHSMVTVVDPGMDCDTSDQSDVDTEIQAEVEQHDGEPVNDTYYKNVFMCKYCDRAFVDSRECAAHESSDHNASAPYGCASCDMLFAERTDYIAHTKNVHRNDKPYQCVRCDKCFGRRSDLRKHSIVHTGVRPFRCHFCMKTFSRNTNLSKHLRIHSGQKPHVCPQCPRSFVSKGDLSRHARVHSGAKPFACDQCPLSFRRRDKLAKHRLRHGSGRRADDDTEEAEAERNGRRHVAAGIDPYERDLLHEEAMKMVADNYELPRVPDHISGDGCFSFQNDDSYKCNICNERFARKRELDRHAVVHRRVFACSHCEKKFSRRDKLARHERTHEKIIMNLPCVECGATFTKKDALVAHLKSHFPKFEEENGSSPSDEDREASSATR